MWDVFDMTSTSQATKRYDGMMAKLLASVVSDLSRERYHYGGEHLQIGVDCLGYRMKLDLRIRRSMMMNPPQNSMSAKASNPTKNRLHN